MTAHGHRLIRCSVSFLHLRGCPTLGESSGPRSHQKPVTPRLCLLEGMRSWVFPRRDFDRQRSSRLTAWRPCPATHTHTRGHKTHGRRWLPSLAPPGALAAPRESCLNDQPLPMRAVSSGHPVSLCVSALGAREMRQSRKEGRAARERQSRSGPDVLGSPGPWLISLGAMPPF